MAQQTINIGAAPNDGTGDPLRTAGDKINDNFTELYSSIPTSTDLRFFEQNDFIIRSLGSGMLGFQQYVSGASAAGASFDDSFGLNGTENAIGVVYSATGTTNTGRGAYLRTGNGSITFGSHEIKYRCRTALSALSDGTDTYTAYFGLGDNPNSGDMVNGCYFRYTHSVNSGKIEAVCSNSSTRTASDTGITPTSSSFRIFEIVVNQAASSVAFYIDGSIVSTITTNIPSTYNFSTSVSNIMQKIEKSAGTTDRRIYTDWYDLTITRSTAR